MKQRLLILLLFCSISFGLYAQEREIILSSRYEGKNVVISAEKFGDGAYTVLLKFSQLENCMMNPEQLLTVDAVGKSDILTLKPDLEGAGIRYQYSSRYTQGVVNPKLNANQIYRLPLSDHRRLNVRYLNNADQKFFGTSNAEDWKAFQFIGEPSDTIFAMRKGVVVKIVNEFNEPGVEMSYTSKNNAITIQHSDGTLARYGIVAKDSFMVQVGDVVYPDTPIALLGTLDGNLYETRVTISYPKYNKGTPEGKSPFTWVYLDPLFMTNEGNVKLQSNRFYTPVVAPELLNCEMTKKELKNRAAK